MDIGTQLLSSDAQRNNSDLELRSVRAAGPSSRIDHAIEHGAVGRINGNVNVIGSGGVRHINPVGAYSDSDRVGLSL